MHTGEFIREARKALDLTQAELGERAGVDHTTISRIERGLINSPLRTRKALTDAIGQIKAERRKSA